jgi:glutathione S-transferase
LNGRRAALDQDISMALTLYYHPLSSFCQKALIALYENETAFEKHLVDLMNPVTRAEYQRLWPIAKMPVLRDEARGRTLPEASIVIEYLEQYHPGRTPLIPADPDLARESRLKDRLFDLYVNEPVGKIVTDKLRPAGKNDPHGVEHARGLIKTAYGIIEAEMARRTWAIGEVFTLADCAAAPALFYADQVAPLGAELPNTKAYLQRLMARPSYARALAEAKPYFDMFPG